MTSKFWIRSSLRTTMEYWLKDQKKEWVFGIKVGGVEYWLKGSTACRKYSVNAYVVNRNKPSSLQGFKCPCNAYTLPVPLSQSCTSKQKKRTNTEPFQQTEASLIWYRSLWTEKYWSGWNFSPTELFAYWRTTEIKRRQLQQFQLMPASGTDSCWKICLLFIVRLKYYYSFKWIKGLVADSFVFSFSFSLFINFNISKSVLTQANGVKKRMKL